MPYELCRHIKTNGRRCQSPALSGQNWCYFHDRLTFRGRKLYTAKAKDSKSGLTMPTLVDREACQVSVSLLAEAVLAGSIDHKRASLLLRAIQLASHNLGTNRGLITEPYAPDIVRSFTPTLDGITLAPRAMSDNSTPPKLEPAPPPPEPPTA